jgi:divalent metal cation (Fe/Co/Zn/Cd) transporter
VRSRGRPDSIWVDLHVKVDPAMSTQQSHAIASEVERELRSRIPGLVDAVVHVEPGLGPSPSEWQRLIHRIRAEADAIGVGVHALQIHVEPEGHYSLEMDVEADAALDLGQAHALADRLESRIQEALPAIHAVTSHLEPLRSEIAADPGPPDQANLLGRIRSLADELTAPGAAHELELHRVDGVLTVTMHLTLPARTPLTEAHALAHRVERRVRAELSVIDRVRIHAEPAVGARS